MELSDSLVKSGLDELERFTHRAAEWGKRRARKSVVRRLVTGDPVARDMEVLYEAFQNLVDAGRHLKRDVDRLLDGRSVSMLTTEELKVLNFNLTRISQFLKSVELAVVLADSTDPRTRRLDS